MSGGGADSGAGTSDGQRSLGLYIHIPFCLQKCHYCDFYSEAGTSPALRAKYIDALCREIAWYGGRLGSGNGFDGGAGFGGGIGFDGGAGFDGGNGLDGGARFDGRLVDTIFIGGGTPSILAAEQTVRILSTIFDNFRVADGAEISMECNPATLTAKKLASYKACGINRLSMGVQSMDEGILKIMGRAHGPQDVMDNFRLAREAGFDNINLDVMFGVPGQDMDIWKNTVQKVLALEPEHLSFYSLELAEGTEFYRRLASGALKETAPEEDREMYHWLLSELDRAGYQHYEISNAARPGRECRHNLKYWNLEDYLGLGASAHSFIGNWRYDAELSGWRFSNVDSVPAYVECMLCESPIDDAATFRSRQAACVDWQQENSWYDSVTDYTFTALRRVKGIAKKDFAGKFGRDFWEVFADRKAEFLGYIAAGDAAEDDESLWITRQGMDIASQIIALFV